MNEKKISMPTGLELVRRYFPLATGADADFILWSMTAFPVCGFEHTCTQLAELRAIVGNTRKRGWYRKLTAEARRQDDEMCRTLRELSEERKAADASNISGGSTDAGPSAPPDRSSSDEGTSADAVDPQGGSETDGPRASEDLPDPQSAFAVPDQEGQDRS